MGGTDFEVQDLEPAIIFTKTHTEGFFCPNCNTPLIRARNLIFSRGKQEYWKCSECNQNMRLTVDDRTIHLKPKEIIPMQIKS